MHIKIYPVIYFDIYYYYMNKNYATSEHSMSGKRKQKQKPCKRSCGALFIV